MRREEIISLVSRITELRAEVSRLSGLQKELKALEIKLDSIADLPEADVTASRDPNSMVEKVVAVVERDPNKEWGAEEIAQLLEAKIPSVRAALSKAVSIERIKRTGRGRFKSSLSEDAPADEPEVDQVRAA